MIEEKTLAHELLQSQVYDTMQDASYLQLRQRIVDEVKNLACLLPNEESKEQLLKLLRTKDNMTSYLLANTFTKTIETCYDLPKTMENVGHTNIADEIFDYMNDYVELNILGNKQ
jgi:hypothetical protein